MRRLPSKRLFGELAFVLGVGAIIWLVMRLGWAEVVRALAVIGVKGVLVLALAHVPTLAVLGMGWWVIARRASPAPPPVFMLARLAREAGGEILPFSQVGGFALGLRVLAIWKTPWPAATASSLLDVFAEQAAKVPYTLIGVALLLRLSHRDGVVGPALVLFGVTTGVLGVVVLRRAWIRARLETLAERLAGRWRRAAPAGPEAARATVRQALAPGGGLGLGVGFHLVGWCMGGIETWLGFWLLGARLTLAQALVVDGLFTAVRIFAFSIPGAVGVQEAAYVVLAGLFGVPAPTAVAYSLVRRGRDLLLGAPALVAWQVLERTRRGLGASAGPQPVRTAAAARARAGAGRGGKASRAERRWRAPPD